MERSELTAVVFTELVRQHRTVLQTFHQRIGRLYLHKSYDFGHYAAEGGVWAPPWGVPKKAIP